jgi:hypothetical protein
MMLASGVAGGGGAGEGYRGSSRWQLQLAVAEVTRGMTRAARVLGQEQRRNEGVADGEESGAVLQTCDDENQARERDQDIDASFRES